MQIRESSQGFVVVLEPGEELVSCLTAFARQYDIDSAVVNGFGAVEEVELGAKVGQPAECRVRFSGALEICALQGTIGLLDGEPYPHVHGSFSRADCTTIGGHVCQAVCAGSLELVVQPWAEALLRHGTRRCCCLNGNRVETTA